MADGKVHSGGKKNSSRPVRTAGGGWFISPTEGTPRGKGEGAYSDGAAAGSAVDGLDDGAEQFDVELLVLHVFGRGKKGFVIVVVFLVVLGGL